MTNIFKNPKESWTYVESDGIKTIRENSIEML